MAELFRHVARLVSEGGRYGNAGERRVTTQSTWRHFRGDFIIYAASKAFVGLSSFLALRILTRTLAPGDYGAYTLLFALSTINAIVATSYLSNSVVRFMPVAIEQHGRRRFDVAVWHISLPTVLAAVLLAAVSFGVLFRSGAVMFSPGRAAACLFAAAGTAAYQICVAYAYSCRQRRRYAMLSITQMATFVLGAAALNVIPVEPVAGAITALGLSYVLSVLLGGWRWLPWRARTLRLSSATLRAFVRYGTPLIALNIAIQLNTYLDQFMLRVFRGTADVGLYAANYMVADKIVYALASVTAVTITPLVFREWEKGAAASAYRMLWRAAFVFLIMGIPVLVLMLLFGDRTMSILTDSAFAPGRVIIPFVTMAAIFSGVAAIMSDTLTLHNRTLDLALCYFVGLMINLVCDLILIPPYGIIGCAVSTLVAFAALAVIVILRAHMVGRVLEHFWPALKGVMRTGDVSA